MTSARRGLTSPEVKCERHGPHLLVQVQILNFMKIRSVDLRNGTCGLTPPPHCAFTLCTLYTERLLTELVKVPSILQRNFLTYHTDSQKPRVSCQFQNKNINLQKEEDKFKTNWLCSITNYNS
jgi:hypothetical protein